jgi:hypothetical protein
MTRRFVALMLVLCCLVLPGCDLLDRLFPEPAPDCPYPQFVCDLLDDVDTGLGDRVDCVRDCFED